MADQLFDRGNGLAIGRRDHGNGGPAAARAASATDAVDIIIGMMRHVEIEHVADIGNIEPAGGDVRGDQELDFALAERIERGRAGGLVQIAVQCSRVEAMTNEPPR